MVLWNKKESGLLVGAPWKQDHRINFDTGSAWILNINRIIAAKQSPTHFAMVAVLEACSILATIMLESPQL